jgi:hypothetical protein
MSNKSHSIIVGKPTAPDVKKLMAAFTDIEAGAELPYEAVAAIIGVQPGTSRFRVVTDAWRKRLLDEHNFLLVPSEENRRHFRRLTEEERSRYNLKGFYRGVRTMTRRTRDQHRVITTHMSDHDRIAHDHFTRLQTEIVENMQTHLKEIGPPKPPRQLPRSLPKNED